MPEPCSAMAQIANQIKHAREAADLSQHELDERAGVSRLSAARVEGGGDVNTATPCKIAATLGLSLWVGSQYN